MNLLEIVLPASLVLLTAYLLIHKQLKNDQNRRNFELKKDSLSVTTPIRLRAYERLILLLERTTPATLLLNVTKPGMTNLELQSQLLSTIRQEFSHNISQQLYVSKESWKYIRGSQESLIQLVNSCSSKCNLSDSATILAELIIQVYNSSEQTPTELAINILKDEVQNYL